MSLSAVARDQHMKKNVSWKSVSIADVIVRIDD